MLAMLTNSFDSTALLQSIGWCLFHFLWQGCLIALLIGLLLSVMQRCSASVRYWVACTGLVMMAVCPLITYSISTLSDSPIQTTSVQPTKEKSPHPSSKRPVDEAVDTGPAATVDPVERKNAVSVTEAIQNERLANHQVQETPPEMRSITAPRNALEPAESILSVFQSKMQPLLPWLVAIWMVGVFLLSIRMMVAWFRVQRIKSSGQPLSDNRIQMIFARMTKRLGIASHPRLLESAQVVVPTVIGWLKPTVLMPASAMTGLNADQLSAILAHELAHVRRADYLVNLAQTFIEIVLFYHPCVWWLSARIRTERENCCDDLATEACGGVKTYAEALLHLEQAKESSDKPALAMGANGSSLVDRVARLLGKSPQRDTSSYWLAGVVSLSLAVLAISLVVPGQVATAKPIDLQEERLDPAKSTESHKGAGTLPEKIKIRVLDSEGMPIEGAQLMAGVWSKDRTFPPTQQENTDADGNASFNLPKNYYILRLWAMADGHTRLFVHWEEKDIKAGDVPPADFTFEMIKGATIGGVIQDEDGKPIEGAKVGVSATATHPGSNPKLRYGSWYALASGSGGDTRIITDKNGRWSLSTLPPAKDLKVKINVGHPDFIDDPNGQLQLAQGVTTEQLLSGNAIIKMKSGTALEGTVVDEDGQAIDRGIVVWGDQPYWEQGRQETRIEPDGTFELPPLPNGPKRITVIAPGFRPETRIVEITRVMSPLEFEMVGGNTVRIQVQDGQTGDPIGGAYVGIESWRSCQAMYNHQHPNVIDSQIPSRADALGTYIWDWAPDDAVTYNVSALGYSPKTRIRLSPDDNAHVVKLFKPLTISGNVVDAGTKEAIPQFSVIPVVCRDRIKAPGRTSQRRNAMEQGRSGRFRIELQNEKLYRLLIEAKGYKPTMTEEVFKLGDEVPRLRVELEPAKWASGKVVSERGEPVDAAQVMLASKSSTLQLREYRFGGIVDFANSTNSAKDGTFQFPQSDEPITLVAMHKQYGYAEVTRHPGDELGELKMKPWSSVKGVLYDSDGKPASGVRIAFEGRRYEYDHSYHVQDMVVVVTDNQGRYEFPRLPPIVGTIRALSHMTKKLRTEQIVPVDLSKKKEQVVDIGGSGVKLVGRVKLVGSNLSDVDYSRSQLTMIPIAEPEFGLPTMLQKYDWRKGWTEVKRVQDENLYWPSLTYLRSFRSYHIRLDKQGQFELQLAHPGEFDLGSQLNIASEELGGGVRAHAIGEGNRRISISEADFEAAKRGTPIDIGELTVQAYPQIQVGDEVPDFEFRNSAGETSRLHQQRGHYVLLDFWAEWCEVCQEDNDQLNELANELMESKSTARILSVELPGNGNYTRATDATKSVWTANKLIYDQDTLSIGYKSVFKSLGVWTVPRYLIVDPEGKLVYHGNVAGAVEKMRQLK